MPAHLSQQRLRAPLLLWPVVSGAALLAVVVGTRVGWGRGLPLAAGGIMAAGLLLIVLPGLAVAAVLEPTSLASSLAVVLGGAGTAGMILFWLWFANTTAGWVGTGVILGISTIVLMRRRSTAVRRCIPVLLIAGLIGGLYVGVAADRGRLNAGPPLIEGRYLKSFDDQVPRWFAERLIDGKSPKSPILVADWHSSDRPPLQTGMLLLDYPFVHNRPFGYLCLAVGINALWVLGLWALLDALRVERRAIPSVVLGVGLTGAVFVNTLFVWPKMLGAAMALAAAAVVVETREQDLRFLVVVASICATLALLAHGTTAFAIPGVVVLFLMSRRHVKWRYGVLAVAVIAALYLPWMAYQHWYDPPGNRLLIWHLAGIVNPAPGTKFSVAFRNAYTRPSVSKLVSFKLANVRLLFDPTMHGMLGWTPGWGSVLGRIREAQLTRLFLAPGVTTLGLVMLLRRPSRRPWLKPMLVLVGVTTGFWCLMEYGGTRDSATWLHQGPYTLVVLLPALGVLGAWTLGRRAVIAMLVGETLLFAVCWTFLGQMSAAGTGGSITCWFCGNQHISHSAQAALDPVAVLLGLACGACLAAIAIVSSRTGPPPPTPTGASGMTFERERSLVS